MSGLSVDGTSQSGCGREFYFSFLFFVTLLLLHISYIIIFVRVSNLSKNSEVPLETDNQELQQQHSILEDFDLTYWPCNIMGPFLNSLYHLHSL